MIDDRTGEMRELEDDWRQAGGLTMDEEWTGWAELALVEEDEEDYVRPDVPPPPSAAVKRTRRHGW